MEEGEEEGATGSELKGTGGQGPHTHLPVSQVWIGTWIGRGSKFTVEFVGFVDEKARIGCERNGEPHVFKCPSYSSSRT